MSELIFQKTSKVEYGGNTFVNVPVLLRFDDIPLIEVVRKEKLGLTTSIPIYGSDGTYLAKVVGTRIYSTPDAAKVNFKVIKESDLWACTMEGNTLFEVRHSGRDTFKMNAELYTDTGYFVKTHDHQELYSPQSQTNKIMHSITGNNISNVEIGIWIRSSGQVEVGRAISPFDSGHPLNKYL